MLFYFTGTGNSLYVAKRLERQPISIPQVMHREDLTVSDDRIGIVAPIYGHENPVIRGGSARPAWPPRPRRPRR